jgi:hypothetical protein
MPSKKNKINLDILIKSLPILLSIVGGFFVFYVYFYWNTASLPIEAGMFFDSLTVPVDFIKLGSEIIPLELENFIIFQNYESLPPTNFPGMTNAYGIVVYSLILMSLALVTSFRKMYFIGGAAAAIFLFTFSGINGLNIGGLSSNYALIGLLIGVVGPMLMIHFFAEHWAMALRIGVIMLFGWLTLIVLVKLSEVQSPELLVAEHLMLPASLLAALFFLHIGHAFISGISILLIRLNTNLGLKISWQLTIIFILYFFLVLFSLLDIMGEVNLPFPTVPPIVLMLISGVLGYFVLNLKLQQVSSPFPSAFIGQTLYWIGFAIATLTWGRAILIGNQPLQEFYNHIFLYSQIALSLLFFAYLLSNFMDLLNSGKAIDQVIFKPEIFAYSHMRIGSIMAIVILAIYADGIIGVQLASASTNVSADYYYQTNRPLEAAILYENAWLQYRKNDKAKIAASHLRYALKQPSAGLDLLVESFDYAPNVPGIIMLSNKLHQSEKIFEALFYLEKGLEYFPENPYLQNNLALLYSKINRPQDAIETVSKSNKNSLVQQANLLALQLKHKATIELRDESNDDLILKINKLAYYNQLGDFAPFSIPLDQLPEDTQLQNVILRNQWSNKVDSSLEQDLAHIDSMLNSGLTAFEDLNLRETRILRTYQAGYLNETLKYLSGTAAAHPRSAGYFYAISSNILAGQLDYHKAAIDLEQAIAAGFQNFRPHHLIVLYFGGKAEKAKEIQQRYNIPSPFWFETDESGILIANNAHVQFHDLASKLNSQFGDRLVSEIQKIENPELKADLMLSFLLQKAHWLSKTEVDELLVALASISDAKWTVEELKSYPSFLESTEADQLATYFKRLIKPESSLVKNAYLTPLILNQVGQEDDNLIQYSILQEAIQFNRDPILWINFVQKSRELGLDNYASDALVALQEWLSLSEIEKLQLENQ